MVFFVLIVSSITYLLALGNQHTCDGESYNFESIENDKHLIHKTITHMKNKHVMFIGDSLSRFHYFSFIYALKYHFFMDNNINPNPTNRRHFTSDYNFFDETNKMFSPSHCDCYRPPISWQNGQIENRYYYDLKHHFNVTYYIYYGHDKLQGHWADNGDSDDFRRPRNESLNSFWSYHIEEFFNHLPSAYHLQPSIVVLNVGIHVPHEEKWRNTAYLEKVARECTKKVPNVIFRTTTWSQLDHIDASQNLPFKHEFRDELMCNYPNMKCMNVSWTRCVSNESYIDDFHYIPEVYNRMARQLMSTLLLDTT